MKHAMAASLYLPINRHFIAALTHCSSRLIFFLLPNCEPGVIILFAFVIIFYEEHSHELCLADSLMFKYKYKNLQRDPSI